MTAPHWTTDDLRIVGDVVLASLLAGSVRLVMLKAILEPVAAHIGRKAYGKLDAAMGDRLPNLPE